ncbi:MAG: hypothetical protein GWN58_17620 [Anaerolineae bacterium]|nr:hypothetical protein [Anaerolineae bacterium]
MSELKACPIPLCGGKGEKVADGRKATCANRTCILRPVWMPLDVWQVLPRVSPEVSEVAREIKKEGEIRRDNVGKPTRHTLRLLAWAARLESAATPEPPPVVAEVAREERQALRDRLSSGRTRYTPGTLSELVWRLLNDIDRLESAVKGKSDEG